MASLCFRQANGFSDVNSTTAINGTISTQYVVDMFLLCVCRSRAAQEVGFSTMKCPGSVRKNWKTSSQSFEGCFDKPVNISKTPLSMWRGGVASKEIPLATCSLLQNETIFYQSMNQPGPQLTEKCPFIIYFYSLYQCSKVKCVLLCSPTQASI